MTVDLSRRRHLGMLSLSLLTPVVLSACGGAEGDELRDPTLLTENQGLRERAEISVAGGLVGAVYASQHQSTEKLYLGVAGHRAIAGPALTGSESFQLASLSKALTAALVAHGVEQGYLRWDSRPVDVLPELAQSQHPGYSSITLAQLLDHLSGLPPFNEPSDIAALTDFIAALPTPLPQTDAERRRLLARWMMAQAPAGRPGQDFIYSNAGYTVAGAMLEAATGQDFESLMRQWAGPRGLQVQWRAPSNAAQGHEGPNPAALTVAGGFDPKIQPWVDAIKPAGDLWMAPAEYARWLAKHQRALQGRPHSLPASYVQRLRGLSSGAYALGWQGSRSDGRGILVHSGADKGFMGLVALAQDGRSSYFALSNT